LILFVAKFISESKSQTIGDYGVKVSKKFNYKSLGDFVDINDVKVKFEEIKKQDNKLYKDNRQAIDLFLDNFNNRDKADDLS